MSPPKLPDLDAIDWANLEHAYGPADDVPAMLRGLLDTDEQAGALEDFRAAVVHQGWATLAAPACVPWLAAALDHPAAPLAELIVLLVDLASAGSHEHWLENQTVPPPAREADEFMAALRSPVLACHGRFVTLLEHRDAMVRSAAALALAGLPEEAAASLGPLRGRARVERKKEPLASVLLALGYLGSSAELPVLTDALSRRVAKVVATAGRAAQALLDPTGLPDDVVMHLLAAAAARHRERGLCWAEGDVSRLAGRVITAALTEHAPPDRIYEVLSTLKPHDEHATRLLDTLVKRAFPAGARVETSSRLQEDQARVVTAVLARKHVLTGHLGGALRTAGLPGQVRGMRIFLGLEDGGVMDGEVTLPDGGKTPLWRAVARAVQDGEPRRILEPIAAQLSPEEAFGACREVVVDRHHWPDIHPGVGRTPLAAADAPVAPLNFARMVAALAELLRAHGEAVAPLVEEEAASLLAVKNPHYAQVPLWIVTLARVGDLDARWDPLLVKLVKAPPAYRTPFLTGEVLRTLPAERREPIVLASPLLGTSTAEMTIDGETYSSTHIWAYEGWYYISSCPSPAVLETVVEAIVRWAELPDLPRDVPRAFHVEPHGPFPERRAREFLEVCDPALATSRLEALLREGRGEESLVRRLLDHVVQGSLDTQSNPTPAN